MNVIPGTTVSSHCRTALKEREELCLRLADGRQILLLRKGGILESCEGFRVERREFLLFPTRFHEQGSPPPPSVEMMLFAELEASLKVDELACLQGLEAEHGLPWADVEKRFHYGREPGVTLLFLKVWRLAQPVRLEDAARFDGCRSWVDLEADLALPPATPVLESDVFRARLEAIRKRVHG